MTFSNDAAARDSSADLTVSRIAPWLHVVGLGEDGLDGLGLGARDAIGAAQIVFGGQRHLELVAPAITGAAHPWPVPFDASMAKVLARRGEAVCVLASGDPMHFGVGATLARLVSRQEMKVWPAPSSFSLAAARLGWAIQDVTLLSLHGRDEASLHAQLFPNRRVLALTSDGDAPARLAQMLTAAGFGASTLHVLEALGGPRERLSSFRVSTLSGKADANSQQEHASHQNDMAPAQLPVGRALADAINGRSFDPLNVVGLDLALDAGARPAPLGSGLDDSFFAHDGQITKREIRAITLAALAPLPGQLLWDIGAGSGSIGIEWLRVSPIMRAIAIEQDAVRSARARANAMRLGVPQLDVRTGAAPEALASLPAPDAIFIGGGAREIVVAAARDALRPGGRLVINAVTLETQALLTALQQRHGGALTSLSIARTVSVGAMTAWRPAMPIMQWVWVKPEAARYVAGVGCRAGASAGDIEAAVRATLKACTLTPASLTALACTPARADFPSVRDAAEAMGLPLLAASESALAGASSRCITHSDASLRAANLPSVSEAAALAVAGTRSRLLGARSIHGTATCAIAFGPVDQDPT